MAHTLVKHLFFMAFEWSPCVVMEGLCLFLLSVEGVVCHAVLNCSPKVAASEPPNLHNTAILLTSYLKQVSLFELVSINKSRELNGTSYICFHVSKCAVILEPPLSFAC